MHPTMTKREPQMTEIEWTDETWTPLRARVKRDAALIAAQRSYTSLIPIAEKMAGRAGPHCEQNSEGCGNCYSETNNSRCLPSNGTGLPFDRRSRDLVDLFLDEHILTQPFGWKRPRRIFLCSQTDAFGEWVLEGWLDRIFEIMALTPSHTYQVLTKRPERMREYWLGKRPLPHVWLGTSIENRKVLHRIDALRGTDARVRFLSVEPLLEDIGALNLAGIHWVIVGGESGSGARPCSLTWLRNVAQQCRDAGVACFMKQWGAYALDECGYRVKLTGKGGRPDEWPSDLKIREFPLPQCGTGSREAG